MNHVTPYYFPDRQRLSRIEETLLPLLKEVVARWWPRNSGSLRIGLRECTKDDIAASGDVRHGYRSGERNLLFVGTDRQWANAASSWLGTHIDQPSPLTKELESRYCSEIAASFNEELSRQDAGASVDFHKTLGSYLRPGAGGLVLEIAIGDFSHKVITSANMFPNVFDNQSPGKKSSLVSVADAIGKSTVVLGAYLAPTRVPLADVAALTPGSFLNLKHDLSGEIFLAEKNSNILIRAEIGQRESRKAALVVKDDGKTV